MATKSFLKNVVINNEKEALMFINALEEAEKAAKKRKRSRVKYRNIEDKKTIKSIFSKME